MTKEVRVMKFVKVQDALKVFDTWVEVPGKTLHFDVMTENQAIERYSCSRASRMEGPRERAQPRHAEQTRQLTSIVRLCKCSMPKHISVQ